MSKKQCPSCFGYNQMYDKKCKSCGAELRSSSEEFTSLKTSTINRGHESTKSESSNFNRQTRYLKSDSKLFDPTDNLWLEVWLVSFIILEVLIVIVFGYMLLDGYYERPLLALIGFSIGLAVSHIVMMLIIGFFYNIFVTKESNEEILSELKMISSHLTKLNNNSD